MDKVLNESGYDVVGNYLKEHADLYSVNPFVANHIVDATGEDIHRVSAALHALHKAGFISREKIRLADRLPDEQHCWYRYLVYEEAMRDWKPTNQKRREKVKRPRCGSARKPRTVKQQILFEIDKLRQRVEAMDFDEGSEQ